MKKVEHTPGPLAEFAAKKRLEKAGPDMLAALQAIADGSDMCLCDHSDENCCVKVGEYCARCIAEIAIAKAKGTRP